MQGGEIPHSRGVLGGIGHPSLAEHLDGTLPVPPGQRGIGEGCLGCLDIHGGELAKRHVARARQSFALGYSPQRRQARRGRIAALGDVYRDVGAHDGRFDVQPRVFDGELFGEPQGFGAGFCGVTGSAGLEQALTVVGKDAGDVSI